MYLSPGFLGFWPPSQPLPDLLLLKAMRRGHLDMSACLYRRHYRTVHTYAASCVRNDEDAHSLAEQAFTALLPGRGHSAAGSRMRWPHCVRLQLLDNVRTIAATGPLRWRGDLSVAFWSWVGLEELRPEEEGGPLEAAFTALPAAAQCLMWHMSVEQETVHAVSELVGLSPGRVARDSCRGSKQLRRRWLGAQLAKLAEPACRRALRQLQGPFAPTGRRGAGHHLAECARCAGLWATAAGLDQTLATELPRRVLGWWPHDNHDALPLVPPPQSSAPRAPLRPRAEPNTQDRPDTKNGPRTFSSPARIALLSLALWIGILCVMAAWPQARQEQEPVDPTTIWITSQPVRQEPAVHGQERAAPVAEHVG
ncbi:hypothetical protein AB0C81_18580 [Streptomyces roseoverticillatus]|uniref:hypothetical protein n=1 Tax=Streptomyces roseoverticillatus TaxID=66429 RepID=UPI0033F9E231